MKSRQRFAFALFAAAALFATPSCSDDDSWRPTWAVPLVKDMSLQLSGFVGEEELTTFNERIKEFWNDYVDIEMHLPVGEGGQDTVNLVAYEVLTKKNDKGDYYYVDMVGGTPRLNDTTKQWSLTQEEISSIDEFLAKYKTGGSTVKGDSAINCLLNGVANGKDAFIITANLLERMRQSDGVNYTDSVNYQLDSILTNASMNELISLNLNELTQGVPISHVKLGMDIENTMPFKVKFNASFVDTDSAPTLPIDFRDEHNNPIDSLNANASKTKCSFDSGDKDLAAIFEKTTGVQLNVDCKKHEDLTPDKLRKLAGQGITFSMRVKIETTGKNLANLK